jgi:hypothetical protein
MFDHLDFKYQYWERGMGFQGKMVCSGGKVVVDEVNNYRGMKGG